VKHLTRSSALTLLVGSAGLALPVRAADLPVIRVGTNPVDSFAESFIGVDRGIFRDHGLDVQLETLSNGSTIAQAVIAGALDVGLANIVQVASAVAHGLPIQMIAPAAVYSEKHAYSQLCVAKNSRVATPKDLAGSTIAVSTLNDFNQLGVSSWLESNGVPPSSVKFVEIKFPAMGPALQRGTVQAATIAEPALSDSIGAGQARAFANAYSAIAPAFVAIVWFAGKSWIAKNPEAKKALVSAIYATARYANDHTAETAPILARAAKIDPAVVAKMTRAFFATSYDPKQIEPPLNFAFKYKLLTRPVTPAEIMA